MPEIMTSSQTEHDECHRAKLMGVKDIQQINVISSPDSTTKFGLQKVQTQLAEYIQAKLAGFETPTATESSKPITRSALQVIQDLKY